MTQQVLAGGQMWPYHLLGYGDSGAEATVKGAGGSSKGI